MYIDAEITYEDFIRENKIYQKFVQERLIYIKTHITYADKDVSRIKTLE